MRLVGWLLSSLKGMYYMHAHARGMFIEVLMSCVNVGCVQSVSRNGMMVSTIAVQ